ncbi:hypothetical protein [Streptomyces sp. NPDC093089]|uniref:hypothetical protein n=1 Tax=Streptomyces sp. NPDC093089 TaxID=3366024 RepID=UPI00381F09DD
MWALVRRSRLRRALGDADADADADGEVEVEVEVVDLDRAQALSLDDPWLVGGARHRGSAVDTRRGVAQYDRAAPELDPDHTWALGSRAPAQHALGRGYLALTDLDRALGIDPEYGRTRARARRAEIVAVTTAEGRHLAVIEAPADPKGDFGERCTP